MIPHNECNHLHRAPPDHTGGGMTSSTAEREPLPCPGPLTTIPTPSALTTPWLVYRSPDGTGLQVIERHRRTICLILSDVMEEPDR